MFSLNGIKFFKTIKFRLSALFCLITIVLSTLAGVTFYDHQKDTLFGQLKENIRSKSQNLAKNAGAALLDSDEMQLSVLVFTELKNPGVLSVAVLDHEGRALIHSDIEKIGDSVTLADPARLDQSINQNLNQNIPEKNLAENQLKEITPILINGKKIGSVLLVIDRSSALNKINRLRLWLITSVLLFIGVGCYIIIRIIGSLLAPLDVLSEAAVKVGQGDLSVRVEEIGGEETRKLGKVFNEMTKSLTHANKVAEEGYLQSVMALSAAVEAKDPYTRGHCDRVAHYSRQVAIQMGMDEASLKQLVLAGELHDLGKIGVDNEVLCKPGRLTQDEFDHIACHPMIAWQILEPALFLASVRDIIIVHHERFDGKGYPNGLRGDEICLAGKILAVTDSYDAMTSNRPYRKNMGEEKALAIIKEERGRQFDPDIVDVFLKAHPSFEDREVLDERLEISSRGRVWVYDEDFSGQPETKKPAVSVTSAVVN